MTVLPLFFNLLYFLVLFLSLALSLSFSLLLSRMKAALQGEAAREIECWLALARVPMLDILVIVVAHAAAHVAARDHVEVVAPGPTHLVIHLRRIPRLRASSSSTAAVPGYHRVRLPPSEEDPPPPRPSPRRSRTAWQTVDEPGGSGDGGGCGQVAASTTVGEHGGSGFVGGRWRAALRAILSF